ncbi:hypothetical protein [Pedobacter sp. HDW13]
MALYIAVAVINHFKLNTAL